MADSSSASSGSGGSVKPASAAASPSSPPLSPTKWKLVAALVGGEKRAPVTEQPAEGGPEARKPRRPPTLTLSRALSAKLAQQHAAAAAAAASDAASSSAAAPASASSGGSMPAVPGEPSPVIVPSLPLTPAHAGAGSARRSMFAGPGPGGSVTLPTSIATGVSDMGTRLARSGTITGGGGGLGSGSHPVIPLQGSGQHGTVQKKRKNTIVVTAQNDIFTEFQRMQAGLAQSAAAAAAAASSAQTAAVPAPRHAHVRNRSTLQQPALVGVVQAATAAAAASAASSSAASSSAAAAASASASPAAPASAHSADESAALPPLTRRRNGSGKTSRRSSDSAKSPPQGGGGGGIGLSTAKSRRGSAGVDFASLLAGTAASNVPPGLPPSRRASGTRVTAQAINDALERLEGTTTTTRISGTSSRASPALGPAPVASGTSDTPQANVSLGSPASSNLTVSSPAATRQHSPSQRPIGSTRAPLSPSPGLFSSASALSAFPAPTVSSPVSRAVRSESGDDNSDFLASPSLRAFSGTPGADGAEGTGRRTPRSRVSPAPTLTRDPSVTFHPTAGAVSLSAEQLQHAISGGFDPEEWVAATPVAAEEVDSQQVQTGTGSLLRVPSIESQSCPQSVASSPQLQPTAAASTADALGPSPASLYISAADSESDRSRSGTEHDDDDRHDVISEGDEQLHHDEDEDEHDDDAQRRRRGDQRLPHFEHDEEYEDDNDEEEDLEDDEHQGEFSDDEHTDMLASPASPSAVGTGSTLATLSPSESLAELSLVRMSRFTLRFENGQMEALFVKHFQSKLRENFGVLHVLVILQHVFLGVVEYVTHTSAKVEKQMFAARMVIVAAFMASALFTYGTRWRRERAQAKQAAALADEAAEEAEHKSAQAEAEQQHNRAHSNADSQLDRMENGLPALASASSLNESPVPSPGASPPRRHLSARRLREESISGFSTASHQRQNHNRSASEAPSAGMDEEEDETDDDAQPTAAQPPPPPGEGRLFLLPLSVTLNLVQGVCLLVAFTLASQVRVTMPILHPPSGVGGGGYQMDIAEMDLFTLYSPTAGELSTAFSLLLYGFIFVGSGMLLIYALPLALLYFLASLAISLALRSPGHLVWSSLVLQSLFLLLGMMIMYSMEGQTRKELILLCTVARDRARGNDLINNMLPPSMVLRLQIMQQRWENQGAIASAAGTNEENETGQLVEAVDEAGNIVLRRVSEAAAGGDAVDEHGNPISSSAAAGAQALSQAASKSLSTAPSPLTDASLLTSAHFYDTYDEVSILFCYVSSFHALVVGMHPQALVRLLNDVYSAFDDAILGAEGMYKVEAIAETYMAVSGCPFPNPQHGSTAAGFAMKMLQIVEDNQTHYESTIANQISMLEQQLEEEQRVAKQKEEAAAIAAAVAASMSPPMIGGSLRSPSRRTKSIGGANGRTFLSSPSNASQNAASAVASSPPLPQPAVASSTASALAALRSVRLSIQVGIHSGPIAAGVIGTKTLSYHLFGDAVNTASRMCSTGEPGMVHVSEFTAREIEDEFQLESRGIREVKGKGNMHTYYCLGPARGGAGTVDRQLSGGTSAGGANKSARNVAASLAAFGSSRSTAGSMSTMGGAAPNRHSGNSGPVGVSSPRMPVLPVESASQEAERHAVESFSTIVAINEAHQQAAHLPPTHPHSARMDSGSSASSAHASHKRKSSLSPLHGTDGTTAPPLLLMNAKGEVASSVQQPRSQAFPWNTANPSSPTAGGGGTGPEHLQVALSSTPSSSLGGAAGTHLRNLSTASSFTGALSPIASVSGGPVSPSGTSTAGLQADLAQSSSPRSSQCDTVSPAHSAGPSFSQPHNPSASPPLPQPQQHPSVGGGGGGGAGGTAKQLEFVAEFPASRWTLRLSEPALEAEFHTVYLAKTHRHLRVIIPILTLVTVVYMIAGACTIPAYQLKYFLPQCAVMLASLAGLGALWWKANDGVQGLRGKKRGGGTSAAASAAPSPSPASAASSASSAASAVSSSSSKMSNAARNLFHRHDQLLIGSVVCVLLVSVNMSGLYTHTPGGSLSNPDGEGEEGGALVSFRSDESGTASLVSSAETLVNFNILALMSVFFALRLYYRTAWVVALVVWADLVVVFALSSEGRSGVQGVIMSLSVVLVFTLLSAYASYSREYTVRFDFLLERVLVHEKNNLFTLLQNMLPSPRHAHALMLGLQVIEEQPSVTLLYSDIRGFTALSSRMQAQDLCTLLNSLYSAFDEHLDPRGVYKIDTIGDAFVVVGGLSIENSDVSHAMAIADFALDMLGEIEAVKSMWGDLPASSPEIQGVTMRIGVHSGSVIAATVGLIRPKYLLFGTDTLIANRMESEGIPGQIQMSQSSYELLNPCHTHLMEPRGVLDMGRGLGKIQTYLLKGRYIDILRAARERLATRARDKAEAGAAGSEEDMSLEQLAIAAGMETTRGRGDGSIMVGHDGWEEVHLPPFKIQPPTDGKEIGVGSAVSPAAVAAADVAAAGQADFAERKEATPAANPRRPSLAIRRRPSLSLQPRPLAVSIDDSAVSDGRVSSARYSGNQRMARLLSKQIAHVRGLSREQHSSGLDAGLPSHAHIQHANTTGHIFTPRTAADTLRAPLRKAYSQTATNTAANSQRNSLLLPTSSSSGDFAAPSGVHIDVSPQQPHTPLTALHSLASPHRRSFTLHSISVRGATGLPPISPPHVKGGLKPPQGSLASTHLSRSAAGSISGLPPSQTSTSGYNLHPPQGREEGRMRAGSAASAITAAAAMAASLSTGTSSVESPSPVTAPPISPAGGTHSGANSGANSAGGPLLPQSFITASPVVLRPATSNAVHRRRSSIGFQRGIAALSPPAQGVPPVHAHRRSTSVIMASAPLSSRMLSSTEPGSDGVSPRMLNKQGSGALRSHRPSLQIHVPESLAHASAAGNDAAGQAIHALRKQHSAVESRRSSTSRPVPARRVRSSAQSGRGSNIAEEPLLGPLAPVLLQAGSRRGSHGRSSTSLISPANGSGANSRNTSILLAAAQAVAANAASGQRPVARHWTVASGVVSPASGDSARFLSPLPNEMRPRAFDDMHVDIAWLRAQHDSDLDGSVSAAAEALAAQRAQEVWRSKLSMLAHRRASVAQNNDAEAAAVAAAPVATSTASAAVTASPVAQRCTILVNDDPVPSPVPAATAPAPLSIPESGNRSGSTSPVVVTWGAGLGPSGPLSPVLDMSPLSHHSSGRAASVSGATGGPHAHHRDRSSLDFAGVSSQLSPMSAMMEHVDETLDKARAEATSTDAAPAPRPSPFNASGSFAFDSSATPSTAASAASSAGVDAAAQVGATQSATPPKGPHGRHSRSSSRLHGHLDVLRGLESSPTDAPTPAGQPSIAETAGGSASAAAAAAPVAPAVVHSPSKSSAPSASKLTTPPRLQTSSPPMTTQLRTPSTRDRNLSTPAGSPSSRTTVRDPIARDAIEEEILRGTILAYATPTTASLRGINLRTIVTAPQGVGQPVTFHLQTPSHSSRSESRSQRRSSHGQVATRSRPLTPQLLPAATPSASGSHGADSIPTATAEPDALPGGPPVLTSGGSAPGADTSVSSGATRVVRSLSGASAVPARLHAGSRRGSLKMTIGTTGLGGLSSSPPTSARVLGSGSASGGGSASAELDRAASERRHSHSLQLVTSFERSAIIPAPSPSPPSAKLTPPAFSSADQRANSMSAMQPPAQMTWGQLQLPQRSPPHALARSSPGSGSGSVIGPSPGAGGHTGNLRTRKLAYSSVEPPSSPGVTLPSAAQLANSRASGGAAGPHHPGAGAASQQLLSQFKLLAQMQQARQGAGGASDLLTFSQSAGSNLGQSPAVGLKPSAVRRVISATLGGKSSRPPTLPLSGQQPLTPQQHARHTPRAPSYGGFNISFRGANQAPAALSSSMAAATASAAAGTASPGSGAASSRGSGISGIAEEGGEVQGDSGSSTPWPTSARQSNAGPASIASSGSPGHSSPGSSLSIPAGVHASPPHHSGSAGPASSRASFSKGAGGMGKAVMSLFKRTPKKEDRLDEDREHE